MKFLRKRTLSNEIAGTRRSCFFGGLGFCELNKLPGTDNISEWTCVCVRENAAAAADGRSLAQPKIGNADTRKRAAAAHSGPTTGARE